MRADVVAISQALKAAPDIAAFWRVGLLALSHYGVTGYCYAATAARRAALENDPGQIDILHTTHCDEIVSALFRPQLLRDDLTVARILRDATPSIWHRDRDWDSASPAQRQRADLERSFGLQVGYSAVCSYEPCFVSGIGMSMSELSEQGFERHWRELAPNLLAIAAVLDEQIRQDRHPARIGLTRRERDCLSWLAAGLRPDQIAERLGIGYRTVDKHLVAARRKLGARTRDQALAKALVFNQIDP